MPHEVGNGAILGIVSEDGVVSRKRIALMDRTNFKVVANTTADEYGAYSFSGLNPYTTDYLIFCVDDDGNPTKQPIIYDKVQPIQAHQGGFFWGNWYHRAMQKEPIGMFLSIPDSGAGANRVLAYGVGVAPAVFINNSPDIKSFSVTPAAANIPSLDMVNVAMGRQILSYNNLMKDATDTSASCEFVFNMTSTTANTNIVLFRSAGTFESDMPYSYHSALLVIKYIAATKTIKVLRNNNSTATASTSEPAGAIEVISFPIPIDLQNTVMHIVASIEYSKVGNLFINGVLVATQSLQGTINKVGSHSNQKYMSLAVTDIVYDASYYMRTSITTISTPMIAMYAEATSEVEAAALYNALFAGTLPTVTGYKKSVVEDYPLYFYRLHDLSSATHAIDALRPYGKNIEATLEKIVPSGIAQSLETPIVRSGNGMDFSGGLLYTSRSFIAPLNPYEVTVEFLAKPSVAGAATRRTILCHANKNLLSYFEVRLSADDRLSLQWREVSAEITFDFVFSLDISQIHHYAFTIDKRTRKAVLYVDGVSVESIDISNTPFGRLSDITMLDDMFLFLGGRLNVNKTSVDYPYKGYLAEVAMYPIALNAQRIKIHYDERNTL